jgi:hypothetical protein
MGTASVEKSTRHTPSGGSRSVIIYQDGNGLPVSKDVAVRAEVTEYDDRGNAIHRTYASLKTEN